MPVPRNVRRPDRTDGWRPLGEEQRSSSTVPSARTALARADTAGLKRTGLPGTVRAEQDSWAAAAARTEAAAGEAVAGEAVAGEAVAGEAAAGEAVAGEAVAGEAVAGWPLSTVSRAHPPAAAVRAARRSARPASA
ncbi:hypothetical protein ACQPZG_00375 (plasmid) [Streptomyces sp. CA-294286]|uniref:hypothetical protein n=1 Tax=Streptomyces sp. CA-294286 TaxID=3240070 RepID=UPI003D900FCC